MWESFGGDTLLLGFQDYILDLLQQPLGCLDAGVGLGEACVVGGVLLEVVLDVIPLELREETFDVFLVLELGGVRGGDLDFAHLGVEFRDVEEVASAAAVLGYLSLSFGCIFRTLLTAARSHRSSSVICTVFPGAVSIVNKALGLTCSGSARTAVAQIVARIAAVFILMIFPVN
jgi:hypothetical protein